MSMASASLTRRSRCTNVWEANKASAYCTSINDDEDEEEEDASDIRSKEEANHEEPTSSGSKSDEVVIECCCGGCCCCILFCLDWTFRRTFLDWNSIRN